MRITDNQNNPICENPIELQIKDISKFVIEDINCNTLFKSNTLFQDKCGEYIIIKVVDPLYNTENCNTETSCSKIITFSSEIQKYRQDSFTAFYLKIENAGTSLIEFKVDDGNWQKANVNNNGILFTVPSNGETFLVTARAFNCDENHTSVRITSFEDEECIETSWVDTGNFRCNLNVSQKEQRSNCENIRWVAGGDACDEDPTECCPTEFIMTQGSATNTHYNMVISSNGSCSQVINYGYSTTNSISTVINWFSSNTITLPLDGVTRYVFVKMEFCDIEDFVGQTSRECVDTTWNNTSEFVCELGFKKYYQISNCGSSRLNPVSSSEPCSIDCGSWVNISEFQCISGFKQYRQINDCSEYRWNPIVSSEPCSVDCGEWVNTLETQCVGGKKQYRQKNDCDEYRWNPTISSEDCETPSPGALKTIPTYIKPTTLNTEVFSSLPSLSLPSNITNVAGHGFSLFSDSPTNSSGKLKLFDLGFTNITNLEAFNRSKWASNVGGQWESPHFYYFQQAYHLIKEASKSMRNNYDPAWGSLDSNDSNPSIHDYNYSGLTIEGAKEMGRRMVGAAKSLDNQSYNIDVRDSVMMIDEESISTHSWAGGSHYELLGYIQQGLDEASQGRKKIFIYAQPISRWFQSRHEQFDSLTNAQLMESLSPSNITYSSVWDNMRFWVDANGGYYKTPFLSNIALYKKDGSGNFIFSNGKRVFRDDNTTISIFQSTSTPVLNNPEDRIKWHGRKPGNVYFEGWQSEWGSYDSVDMTFNLPSGWSWDHNARPTKAGWKSDYEYFIMNTYSKADAMMQDLLLLARREKGTFDIFNPNQEFLMYVELRPVTEPWTAYSNSSQVREIGDGFIFFDTLMNLYSGGKGLSTWDDGRHMDNIEATNGNPLYWDDIEHFNPDGSHSHWTRSYWNSDWTRYHARASAVREALLPLQGTDALNWKHIHFYYPYLGRRYNEVISSGVYVNNKLHIFFINPSLEKDEVQPLTLVIGSSTHTLNLVGHEVYYQTFDAASGLTPEQFTLEYTTIYGKHTKVNGRVTDNVAAHYLIGGPTI